MVKVNFRLVQKAAIFYLVAVFFFGWGIAAARYEVFPWNFLHSNFTEVREYLLFSEGDHDLSERLLLDHQERYSRFDFTGLKKSDKSFTDDGFLLISQYSKEHKQSIVKLFSLAENKDLYTWVPALEEIFARTPKSEDVNNLRMSYRTLHPLLLPDGDLLYSSGAGALVRIDPCGNPRWTIDRFFHHSIELDADGNVLTCIRVLPQDDSEKTPYLNDGYVVVSLDGKILEEQSIAKILLDNGYRALVYGVGPFEEDRFHLNDAQPILEDNGEAKVGDIAFSVRHISTVLLYRPSTGKIIWTKTGPWLNQHDVNPLGDGTYSIFGNDSVRTHKGWKEDLVPVESKVYVYDPKTDETTQPYSKITKQLNLRSDTEGRAKVLENGDVFIEETNACRLMRISRDKVRWEYVSSVTEETNGMVHWCRYIPADKIDLSWLENVTCN